MSDADGDDVVFAGQVTRAKTQGLVARNSTVDQPHDVSRTKRNRRNDNSYSQRVLYDLDGKTSILFGALKYKYNQFFLCLSIILSVIFIYIAITFFGAFDVSSCNDSCTYISINDKYIEYIAKEKLLLLITEGSSADIDCIERRLLFFNSDVNNTAITQTTWNTLQSTVKQTSNMFIMLTSTINIPSCIAKIKADHSNVQISSYIALNGNEYIWLFSALTWWQILCVYMATVFMIYEWLFYSYVEVMVPFKDSRAYFTWFIVRLGLMSFMFSIIVAHSHLIVEGNVALMVGQFEYKWMLTNLYSCTIFIACSMFVCVCCCICQEGFMDDSMGSSNVSDRGTISSTNAKDYGLSRFFLPHSRIEGRVVNELEEVLATSMICTLIFILIFLICGFSPFILFFRRGFNGSVVIPWFASLWFLAMVGMSIQCVWFIRGRLCADEEDKNLAAHKDRENVIRTSRAQSSYR